MIVKHSQANQLMGFRGYGNAIADEMAEQIAGATASADAAPNNTIWRSVLIGTATGVSIWFCTNLLSNFLGFPRKV